MKPFYTSQNATPVRVWKDFSLVNYYKSGRENDI
jgi:hypothetical protein